MFAPFMTNTWIAASAVALIAGVVGFFVVMRGVSFLAHALPHGAFAGAAGAVLVGVNPLAGMGIFAVAGAFAISAIQRKGRGDVAVALTLSGMLGLGALFLALSNQFASELFALLFGQILGVSPVELGPVLVLGVLVALSIALLYRPLLLSSLVPEMAAARGLRPEALSLVFALIVAVATTMSVPVVGALLMFSLLIGPAAAARSFTRRAGYAMGLTVVFALLAVWASIALAYETEWPVGFFVTAISTVLYGLGRAWTSLSPAAG